MPKPSASEVTRLLLAWSAGFQSALEKLAPPRRREPHRLAEAHMSRERPGHTPQTTAPVNEAYLRLVNVKRNVRPASSLSMLQAVGDLGSHRQAGSLSDILVGGHKNEPSRSGLKKK